MAGEEAEGQQWKKRRGRSKDGYEEEDEKTQDGKVEDYTSGIMILEDEDEEKLLVYINHHQHQMSC